MQSSLHSKSGVVHRSISDLSGVVPTSVKRVTLRNCKVISSGAVGYWRLGHTGCLDFGVSDASADGKEPTYKKPLNPQANMLAPADPFQSRTQAAA